MKSNEISLISSKKTMPPTPPLQRKNPKKTSPSKTSNSGKSNPIFRTAMSVKNNFNTLWTNFKKEIHEITTHSKRPPENIEESNKNKKTEITLFFASIIAPILSIIAEAISIFDTLKTVGLVLLIIASVFGIYAISCQIERLTSRFKEFDSTKIFSAAIIALCIFYAHGMASDEINSIFPVDASALPHAFAVATLFNFLHPAGWILAFTSLALLPFLFFQLFVKENYFSITKIGSALISSLFLGWLLINALSSEAHNEWRKKSIYQAAIKMDFNSNFKCENSKIGKDSVLFIGDQQLRALVARDSKNVSDNKFPYTPNFKIPENFDIISCNNISPIDQKDVGQNASTTQSSSGPNKNPSSTNIASIPTPPTINKNNKFINNNHNGGEN